MTYVAVLVFLLLGAAGAAFGRKKKNARELRRVAAAEARLDEDDLDAAVLAADAALPGLSGLPRCRTLSVLGNCAERRGDLTKALGMFDLALDALKLVTTVSSDVVEARALATARRAFALAALDRGAEAHATLAAIANTIFTFETRGQVVRARALIAWKQQRAKDVVDLLDRERMTIRGTLGRRDRALLRILDAQARATFGGIHRAPSAPIAFYPRAIVQWLEAVVPETRFLLGSHT